MTAHKKEQYATKSFFRHGINFFVVFILKGFAFLPLNVLYVLADFAYFLLKNVIRYRNDVVIENLESAFPERSEAEIIGLRNRFYRYFCDVFFESLKLYRMSVTDLEERISFKGVDALNRFTEHGKGVIILACHHQNWEWSSYLQTRLKHRLLMVYNKMRDNEPMDEFLLKSREKWGGEGVQMGRAAKVIFEQENKNIPTVTGLIADQSALPDQGIWTHFLNREAAFFAGPEKIARKTNQPVFFQRVTRLARGKYEYEYLLLIEEPAKTAPNEIMLSYVRTLEKTIREAPEYYLWSHKRWKHKRPDGIKLI